ncbi:hypothetical protein CH063_11623 [Colletotrichum higginsianum]|uniref:Uncharacterized protein n=1 Tax=Colletotrichum higginsianum (strain IMI 349063) TaxID=759273 RepID=H1VM51_COLHI|nr:hypothetical protein CH063_11623 [Colletotrichum higginsianum]
MSSPPLSYFSIPGVDFPHVFDCIYPALHHIHRIGTEGTGHSSGGVNHLCDYDTFVLSSKSFHVPYGERGPGYCKQRIRRHPSTQNHPHCAQRHALERATADRQSIVFSKQATTTSETFFSHPFPILRFSLTAVGKGSPGESGQNGGERERWRERESIFKQVPLRTESRQGRRRHVAEKSRQLGLAQGPIGFPCLLFSFFFSLFPLYNHPR